MSRKFHCKKISPLFPRNPNTDEVCDTLNPAILSTSAGGWIHHGVRNFNFVHMYPSRVDRYFTLGTIFILTSISFAAAQSEVRTRPMFQSFPNSAFFALMAVHFSVLYPVLILFRRIAILMVTYLRKHQPSTCSTYWKLRESMSILNKLFRNIVVNTLAKLSSRKHRKLEVTVAFWIVVCVYGVSQRESSDSLCMKFVTILVTANFLAGPIFSTPNDTRVHVASSSSILSQPIAASHCHHRKPDKSPMDQKSIEVELELANQMIIEGKETMRVRCSLVRHVSHEVRTPLNTAAVGLMILEDEIALMTAKGVEIPTRLLEVVSAIRDACGNALEVVNDLLTFEKIEAGMMALNVTSTPLLDFLKSTAKLQFLPALAKQIKITITPAERNEDICVDIDSVKLGLVFGNLLSNAVKFTPSHGRIDISMRIHAQDDGGHVTVSVRDTGTGLSTENITRLFQEGVQFNANELQNGGGSGFGLYIAKAVVTLHHGLIWAESEGEGEGKGAVFSVQLPLNKHTSNSTRKFMTSPCADCANMTKHVCSGGEVAVKPLTILVVDDSESSRKMMMKLLSMCGHSCHEAKDGRSAVSMISSMLDGSRGNSDGQGVATVDVVLIDNHMPFMSGSTATKKMRESGFQGLIIGLSGDDSCAEFRMNGADKFLLKPVNRKQLTDALVKNILLKSTTS